mmetsp:Transcript_23408/g.68347  ORF Transcript_23408/g.68347 Transcript_23408/m.68347 type:complete len:398 (-) Transcript_23408:282-1475(-)
MWSSCSMCRGTAWGGRVGVRRTRETPRRPCTWGRLSATEGGARGTPEKVWVSVPLVQNQFLCPQCVTPWTPVLLLHHDHPPWFFNRFQARQLPHTRCPQRVPRAHHPCPGSMRSPPCPPTTKRWCQTQFSRPARSSGRPSAPSQTACTKRLGPCPSALASGWQARVLFRPLPARWRAPPKLQNPCLRSWRAFHSRTSTNIPALQTHRGKTMPWQSSRMPLPYHRAQSLTPGPGHLRALPRLQCMGWGSRRNPREPKPQSLENQGPPRLPRTCFSHPLHPQERVPKRWNGSCSRDQLRQPLPPPCVRLPWVSGHLLAILWLGGTCSSPSSTRWWAGSSRQRQLSPSGRQSFAGSRPLCPSSLVPSSSPLAPSPRRSSSPMGTWMPQPASWRGRRSRGS